MNNKIVLTVILISSSLACYAKRPAARPSGAERTHFDDLEHLGVLGRGLFASVMEQENNAGSEEESWVFIISPRSVTCRVRENNFDRLNGLARLKEQLHESLAAKRELSRSTASIVASRKGDPITLSSSMIAARRTSELREFLKRFPKVGGYDVGSQAAVAELERIQDRLGFEK